MSLSLAAHRWVGGYEDLMVDDLTVTAIDGGVIAARRTGISHHLSEAAEITHNGNSTIVGRWLCGGSSVDAVMVEDGREAACLNCRLAASLTRKPAVYFAWGDDDDLLYVGSSINLPQRVRTHMSSTGWWRQVRRLTFNEHETEFEARRAEFEAIAERPGRFNRAGVRDESEPPALGFIVGGDGA